MTKLIFMGTPQFAVPILEALAEQYDVVAVFTQPDRKVGRKQVLQAGPVKQAALALNIPVYQPEKLTGSPEETIAAELAPDLIITAAYGQFLSTSFLAIAPVVNVHGSLLPKYRGGAPIQMAIINGETETGITIMETVKAMDAGGMYAQAKLPLTREDDTGTAFDRLSLLGRDLLLETLPKIIAGTIEKVPQDESQVTIARNITKAQEALNITLPAKQLDQWVRGLRPAVGGWVSVNGQRTKLWAITPLELTTTQAPGTVVDKTKHELIVAAGNGTTFSIQTIQPAGKGQQDITTYLNGAGQHLKQGDQFIEPTTD